MTSHQGQNEKSRRGPQGPRVHQIWCNSDHYFRSYGILKKMAHAIFFRSAAILKVLVRPNWFSNLSEPWVNESRHANFGAIPAIFLQLSWSQHKLAHSCQGRGERSNGAINRIKHLFRSFCRGISNLVTPSLTVAELFQKEGRKCLTGGKFTPWGKYWEFRGEMRAFENCCLFKTGDTKWFP